MAAGLASGLALSTFGALSAALAWGLGGAARTTGQFARGFAMDRETARWDSLSRKSGYHLRHAAASGLSRLTSRWRENSIRAG
jgi:type IV secretion system protein VirB6